MKPVFLPIGKGNVSFTFCSVCFLIHRYSESRQSFLLEGMLLIVDSNCIDESSKSKCILMLILKLAGARFFLNLL